MVLSLTLADSATAGEATCAGDADGLSAPSAGTIDQNACKSCQVTHDRSTALDPNLVTVRPEGGGSMPESASLVQYSFGLLFFVGMCWFRRLLPRVR
jgi:hypothetical protein